MRLCKKLYFLAHFVFFVYTCVFPFRGPQKDLYKKKFIVDLKKNNVQDFIKFRDNGEVFQVFFAPNDDLQGLLVGLMGKEESSMIMTIYSLRDTKIYKAIKDALKRGVAIQIVFDSKFEKDGHEKKLIELEKMGAKIFVFKPPKDKPNEDITGIMHNKYVVFEKNINGMSLLWNGSCNFSSSSHMFNQENIYITSKSKMLQSYRNDFNTMKKKFCYPYEFNGDSDYSNEGNANETLVQSSILVNTLGKLKARIVPHQKQKKAKKKYNLRKRKRNTRYTARNEHENEHEDDYEEEISHKNKKRKISNNIKKSKLKKTKR
ncbi:phospholipase D-like domain-containing protein [Candidatus Dependentiae bacterium]